ncbi:MAG: hypothetical protein NTV23_12705 [Propionibacteriales bacterium]|nr:hypothetical protein [Propionibacteriales bacterium]
MGKALKLPKTKCCVSKSRCDRCPIRMLKDGDLPSGYGVHKRVLVRVDPQGRPLSKKPAKKSELATAAKIQKKSGKKKSKAA